MGGYAWVTLATNDSYSLGALVLARSLEQVGTRQQLAILVTPGVTNAMRSKLTEVFNVVQEVNLLDSRDEENLRLLKRPELGVTFTKLHCWRLTQFDKCVFLDADTLVLENCDELFDREEFSAAPDIGWPDCFNSGVFVYRPSKETFEKLIQFAIDKGSFDGGDQGLLNLYFSDWAHKDISKHLPFIYNMSSTACYSYLPAFKQFGKTAKIIHFIGATKPWLQYFDTETKKVHPSEGLKHLEEVLQRWWDLFCAIHPSLSPEMAGLAGAFAKLTLGAPRTPEQAALDDHLRRQGWEVGNIDYLGRDSFQNIWSKICETLSAAPEQPIPKPESPKVEAKAKEVPPPAEVKSVEKAQTESEEKQKSEQADADDQVVVESRIPEAVAQPPSRSPEQVAKEVEVPKETPVTPKESELPPEGPPVKSATVTSAPMPDTPKESELPPEVPPVTSATVTSTPATPEPLTSVTPTPVSSAPSTPAPVTPAPDTSEQSLVSTTPVPSAISTPVTSVPVGPAPITPASDTSATVTPAPASSAPVTLAPLCSAPVTPAPASSAPVAPVSSDPVTPAPASSAPVAPVSSAPVTPAPASSAPVAPVSSAPVTPASTCSAPVTPTPVTPAAEVIAPVIPDSVSLVPSTQKPVTPDVKTSAPITPAPVSSAPITPAPISSATVIPAEAPAPSTPVPITPDVDSAAIVTPISAGVVAPAPVVISAESSAVKEAAVEKPASVVEASKESDVPATKSSVAQSIGTPSSKEVSAPVTTSSEVPIPQVCPVAPQPKVSAKSSGSSTTSETVSSKEPPKKLSRDPKKLKEETQAPKTQVTEPTPPTTPVLPQVKETKPALEVDPVVPDTPPVPAQESSAAPTPAPRKSNRSDKKTGTKTKK